MLEKAEYTFCYERRERRGELPELVRLPWAFLRLAGAGEERKYVTTIPPVNLFAAGGSVLNSWDADSPTWRQYYEFMPFKPFPLESAKPTDVSGAWALHFYGDV